MRILSKGAEAVIYCDEKNGRVVKERVQKGYRLDKIDEVMRLRRTRREGKLLSKMKGISPAVFEVDEKGKKIVMEFIEGVVVRDFLESAGKGERKNIMLEIGKKVAKMHDLDVAHADLTTSNLIVDRDGVVKIIDFGLGFVSKKIEDKAVDVHLFKHALESKHYVHSEELFEWFLEGYRKFYVDYESVLKRLEKVEGRGRYKGRIKI